MIRHRACEGVRASWWAVVVVGWILGSPAVQPALAEDLAGSTVDLQLAIEDADAALARDFAQILDGRRELLNDAIEREVQRRVAEFDRLLAEKEREIVELRARLIEIEEGDFGFEVSTSPTTAFLGVDHVDHDRGARVIRVLPGTPAERCGILAGDSITAIDHESVTSHTLTDAITQRAPGSAVTVTVLRDGFEVDLATDLMDRGDFCEDVAEVLENDDSSEGYERETWWSDVDAPSESWDVGETYETPTYEEPSYYDTPAYDTPAYETPAYDTPAYETPTYDTPAYETPTYETPTYETPTYETPTYETPTYETPTYEEPGTYYEEPSYYDTPAYDEPSYYDTPAYETPTYEEPTYEEPGYYDTPEYEAPTYEEPSTYYEEPTYEEPTYEDPGTYEAPAYEEPSYYEEPAYEDPGYEESTCCDETVTSSTDESVAADSEGTTPETNPWLENPGVIPAPEDPAYRPWEEPATATADVDAGDALAFEEVYPESILRSETFDEPTEPTEPTETETEPESATAALAPAGTDELEPAIFSAEP